MDDLKDYMRVPLKCPAAGKDTYSSTYTVSTSPDAYTFYCNGAYHKMGLTKANYPQYNSYEGLQDGFSRSFRKY
jgi:hypothetical protein